MEIRLENLTKSYTLSNGTAVPVLKGIDLTLGAGETIAVTGPSGAGKSTLLHLIGLMDRPSSGKLFYDSKDLSTANDAVRAEMRRDRIGFLFQLHYLLPEFTVLENVLIPSWRSREDKRSRALQLLSELGLSHRLEHTPVELSGGEQQRVALARALINEPAVLLADEPTGNLDRDTGEIVESLILRECTNRGITLILVTHNPELARKAGCIVEMRNGKLT
jgi:lipoprotein-releasing system ATP-binding protein